MTCPISNKRYFERGCRPEYKGKACCPTSFSCRKLPLNIPARSEFYFIFLSFWQLMINQQKVCATTVGSRTNWARKLQQLAKISRAKPIASAWAASNSKRITLIWLYFSHLIVLISNFSQDGATIKCSDVECPVVDPPAKGKDGCELVTKPNTCCPSYQCRELIFMHFLF